MSLDRATSDLAKLKLEVARLQAQLNAANEKVLKLEHYIEVTRAYESQQDDVDRVKGGVGTLLVSTVIEILREKGTRQPTRLLVEELERRGLHIGGQNKITNLSGMLSRSGDLVSSRTEGWGLSVWENDAHRNEPSCWQGVESTSREQEPEPEPPTSDQIASWDDDIPF